MNNRGFSLMELVVTILIVAIISAIAVPMLGDSQAKQSWYHEEVKAAVRYAQRQAVAQRRNVYVKVDSAQVELCYTATCTVRLTKLTDGQDYILAAPSGVTLNPTQVFSFSALGQPSGAAPFTVGGQTVTVTSETGYVQ